MRNDTKNLLFTLSTLFYLSIMYYTNNMLVLTVCASKMNTFQSALLYATYIIYMYVLRL